MNLKSVLSSKDLEQLKSVYNLMFIQDSFLKEGNHEL